MRHLLSWSIGWLLVTGSVSDAPAEGLVVDLEIVLAVDVSGSVDNYEARQQRDGYVAALRDPAVIKAIAANEHRRIAVAYIEWAGGTYQQTVADWALIDSEASAYAFADLLERAPIGRERWTSISGGIDYAMPMFDANGYAGERLVIDVSGDGMNNSGRSLAFARDEALGRGIVINGLPILNDRPQPFDMPTPMEQQLDRYYERYVIGGPGSFMVTAQSFEDFKTAVLAKLIREIAAADGPYEVTIAYR